MASAESIDLGASFFFDGLRKSSPAAATAAAGVTSLGDLWCLVTVAAVAAVGFLLTRQARAGLFVVLALLAAMGLSRGVKELVQRPRPAVLNPTIDPGGWSFPSGHALESAALYGSLATLLARRLRPRPWSGLVGAAGVLLPFVIGLTRLFLCVHYVTDVVGGWCAGAALAMLGAWADGVTSPAPRPGDDLSGQAPARLAPPSEGVAPAEDRFRS